MSRTVTSTQSRASSVGASRRHATNSTKVESPSRRQFRNEGHEIALARVLARAAHPASASVNRQRRLLADLCRVLGARAVSEAGFVQQPAVGSPGQYHSYRTGQRTASAASDGKSRPSSEPATPAAVSAGGAAPSASDVPLSPRVRQTLERLLQGDSEKQVARRLRLSAHTVHVYVKALYRKMNVNSRGELLAKFIHAPG